MRLLPEVAWRSAARMHAVVVPRALPPMPIPTITYRVDARESNTHQFHVTLTVPDPSAEQRLSLPVWIPGSYLVREFARHLSGVTAKQGGRDVPLRQLDKTTWRATCKPGKPLTVSY